MTCLFANLPTELKTFVLQTVIYTYPPSLLQFLQAFPELSSLVLLISDHVDRTDQLIVIPDCRPVDLGDHVLISQLSNIKPIRILSFIKCDEEAAFGRLTRSPDCCYGKYMDERSAVFVRLSGKSLFGRHFIKDLANLKRCEQIFFIHNRNERRSHHVETVGGGAYNPAKPVSRLTSIELGGRIASVLMSDDPEYPWVIRLPTQVTCQFLSIINITDISIRCVWCIFCTQRLPHLQRMRISSPLAQKCHDRHAVFGIGSSCDFSFYGLGYAYKVEDVYYEFSGSRTPVILSSDWTCCEISKARQFSFINLDWSECEPSLSSYVCIHSRERGEDYVGWSTSEKQGPLAFLKKFEKVTFIGIPDKIVTLSKLTMAQQLIWKRLMADKPAVSVAQQATISFPSLRSIELVTMLRTDDKTTLMPKIDAPFIHTMDLYAVPRSNSAWNLGFHFTAQSLESVRHVSMTAKHAGESEVVPLRVADLASISLSLVSLSVTGYIPSFLTQLANVHNESSFPNLTDVRLDIAYLPLETLSGQTRPLAKVLFGRGEFGSLQKLTLDLSDRGPSSPLYGGVCNVTVQVPISCHLLTAFEPLACNNFYVVTEDEERCQGRVIHSNEFLATVGEPGYLSLHIKSEH